MDLSDIDIQCLEMHLSDIEIQCLAMDLSDIKQWICLTLDIQCLAMDLSDIGLYRDVWIAAIVSSRTRLATLTGAMCKMSQCKLRSLRVNSGMLNVIRIVTYYTLPPLESPTSSWIAMVISR